ncbi:hypothetical protein [Saccharopolyspora hattusasensis]|uniref:hypothetical protein n=1 Tax=Saccharopolyspora hattusasensis TaxID=1128679 RepID=UPI003D991398
MGLPVRWVLDGLTFNTDPDDHGCQYLITEEKGWSGAPETRTSAPSRATGPGGYPGLVWPQAREIELHGVVLTPTWQARRHTEHRLATLAAEPGRLYELMCTEETGTLTTQVQRAGATEITIRPGGTALDFTITLTAPDPRKYGPERRVSTGLPSSGRGLDFTGGLDFHGGLDFGPAHSTGLAHVANHGTTTAEPRFVLTGPLVAPITITRRDTGAHVIYLDSISADEQVLVDLADRIVLTGRANRRYRLAVTDWDALAIPPRRDGIDYALAHHAAPNTRARLTVCWRSAWN